MKVNKEVKMIAIEGKSLGFYINGRRIAVYQLEEAIDSGDLSFYYNNNDYWK